MIKAAEGGGGKGIRKVEAAEEFGACFRQVRGAWIPVPSWDMQQGPAPALGVSCFAPGLAAGPAAILG